MGGSDVVGEQSADQCDPFGLGLRVGCGFGQVGDLQLRAESSPDGEGHEYAGQ